MDKGKGKGLRLKVEVTLFAFSSSHQCYGRIASLGASSVQLESSALSDDYNSSQLSDRDDNPSGDDHCDTSEDILVPSSSVSNFKHDPADELSSDDENNDKENINPRPHMYPKGGPAKVFPDVEDEEEDDSDHDLMRFEENESDYDEEVDDLSATGFEEAPLDNEKRNLLY